MPVYVFCIVIGYGPCKLRAFIPCIVPCIVSICVLCIGMVCVSCVPCIYCCILYHNSLYYSLLVCIVMWDDKITTFLDRHRCFDYWVLFWLNYYSSVCNIIQAILLFWLYYDIDCNIILTVILFWLYYNCDCIVILTVTVL